MLPYNPVSPSPPGDGPSGHKLPEPTQRNRPFGHIWPGLTWNTICQGVEQAGEYRVWRAGGGPQLRLVEGAHEEWVVNPLDGADLAGGVGGCNPHPVFARDVLQLRR